MNTPQTILKYCSVPRTVTDISNHIRMDRSSIYSILSSLQRSNKLEKRGDNKRRSNPATFVAMRLPPEASENTDEYENLAIKHAHNWFKI